MIDAISTAVVTRPGNSANSVGHQAKAAVAAAKEAGIDVPRNAQGMAASAIAQGAEPGSVFAALTVPEVTETEDSAPPTSETPPQQDVPPEAGGMAETGYAGAGPVIGDAALTDAETALELLRV